MRKKTIVIIACIVVLSSFMTAKAEELPIDIDAIRQPEGYGDAVTARPNIDLFTESSKKVSAYMAEQARYKREIATEALFEAIHFGQTTDAHQKLTDTAGDFALFSQPVNYSNVKMPAETAFMPLWLMILLFAACAVCGFTVARIIAQRKGKKAIVH